MASQSDLASRREANARRNSTMYHAFFGADGPALPQLPRPTPKGPVKRRRQKIARGPSERRRSGRLQGGTPVTYDESLLDQLEREAERVVRRPFKRWRSEHYVRSKEEYTFKHYRGLHWCKEDYFLHPDAVTRDGQSYDRDRGVTCHQCRQKTIDVKTSCSKCHSAKGAFCGPCLQWRYGENLFEVLEDDQWRCPACRDLCNCSAHGCQRHGKGWGATGQLYGQAVAEGYASVAHYLVLTRIRPEDREKVGEAERRRMAGLPPLEVEEEEVEEEDKWGEAEDLDDDHAEADQTSEAGNVAGGWQSRAALVASDSDSPADTEGEGEGGLGGDGDGDGGELDVITPATEPSRGRDAWAAEGREAAVAKGRRGVAANLGSRLSAVPSPRRSAPPTEEVTTAAAGAVAAGVAGEVAAPNSRTEWLGRRVNVFWPLERQWFPGTVRKLRRGADATIKAQVRANPELARMAFTVRYDDGDHEDVILPDFHVVLAD